MTKKTNEIESPEGLSGASMELWEQLAPLQGRSPERRVLFAQALRALDRAEECRKAINSEGMLVQSAGGLKHIHPLIRAEKDARQQFAQLWRILKLNYNHGVDFNRPRGL